MSDKSHFRDFVMYTVRLAAAVALLVLVASVPVGAQNPVPPTVREAAAMPQYGAEQHPATRLAMNNSGASPRKERSRVSLRNQSPCSSQSSPQCGDWVYDNGPVNGSEYAWSICCGNVVSNSFVMEYPGYISWVYFYIWESPGDVLSSVQWSITSAPNGGTVYGSGTASVADDFISTNQYGYNVDIASIGMFLSGLPAQTYWINLFNADSPVGWDQNSGQGCQSYGCPSTAYSGSGQIPSEAFDIGYGSVSPPPCFQAGGNLQVIHDFTAQEDPSEGANGLISDKAGNLYGTTGSGGINGAGLAYELSPKGQGWVFNPLYSFPGGANGYGPSSPILGPDEALYGGASGGIENCFNGRNYCGLVFSLRPAPTACLTALCSWIENTLYEFTRDTDASNAPYGATSLVSDQAGNLYGFSSENGAYGAGAVFQLRPSGSGWTEKILYSFSGGEYDDYPTSLAVSNDGTVYGTLGRYYQQGAVFQIVPSGAEWTEKVISVLPYDGPYSLIRDDLGNLYGVTSGPVIFKLSPSNGTWVLTQLYLSQPFDGGGEGTSGLTMDAAGNLYLAIADYCSGVPDSGCDGTDASWGLVVKVSPDGHSTNLWYSHGVEFLTWGALAVDAGGNVYGTTLSCGANNAGTVWKVTH